ncbi:hypothetical protein TNIN_278001 [Trichonephila inaurata madagascariensis]|uniref:Uncharacterized protein n=1 Tax=Trichonephila inaurata madagascariensis TaxID=2747483 RepID=A0A8X6WUS2_9ARAC|nr:hypothetical protein TNIN_278001 [Trichonephila inaurata madagascariensis]
MSKTCRKTLIYYCDTTTLKCNNVLRVIYSVGDSMLLSPILTAALPLGITTIFSWILRLCDRGNLHQGMEEESEAHSPNYPWLESFLSRVHIRVFRSPRWVAGAGFGIPVPIGVEDLLEEDISDIFCETLGVTKHQHSPSDTRSPKAQRSL